MMNTLFAKAHSLFYRHNKAIALNRNDEKQMLDVYCDGDEWSSVSMVPRQNPIAYCTGNNA